MPTTATKTPATLAEALAAFQADLPKIVKSKAGGGGGKTYAYAPMEKVVEVVYPKATALGLSYSAVPTFLGENYVLHAKLLHTSGEFTEGHYALGNPNAPAQSLGSALTYARRYSLLSLLGLAPEGEDDDGATPPGAPPAAASEPAPAKETIDSVQREMSTLLNANGLTGDDANRIMNEITGGKTVDQWTLTDMKKGRDALKKEIAAKAGS